MAFFRQYIAPFLVVLVFLMALAAVSARIFLPSDMLAPAPAEEVDSKQHTSTRFPLRNAPTLAFTGLRS